MHLSYTWRIKTLGACTVANPQRVIAVEKAVQDFGLPLVARLTLIDIVDTRPVSKVEVCAVGADYAVVLDGATAATIATKGRAERLAEAIRAAVVP
jgi:electron transfer flavoprotein alpha/beta subunit